MLLELIVFLGVLCFVHWLQWRGFFSSLKHPPSFYGFPVVGIVPYLFFCKNQVQLAKETAAKHGPVFRFRLGRTDTIMVNGSEAVKEALKNDDFLGRPPVGPFDLLAKFVDASPFSLMESERWRSLRNHSVQALRELGFGKTPVMEAKIQDEVSVFLDELSSTKGAPYDPNSALLASVSNNISTLIFGDRLPYEHPRRRFLNEFLRIASRGFSYITLLSFVPILTKLCQVLKMKVFEEFITAAKETSKIFTEEFRNHEETFTEAEKRDFMDYSIEHLKTYPQLFTEKSVRGSCLAFFGAGSNTTRVTVEYLLQLLASYPQLQEQMYQEIAREIGVSRLPCWADHGKLHLVNAFIAERMRIFPIIPFGIFRRALRDTQIQGYDVAKGTMLIYNLCSTHFDPKVFDNPEDFDVGRFLDSDGKYVPSKDVIPFAIGKRACPGETFAVFEIFLYTAAIVQRFRVEPEDGKPICLTQATEFLSEAIPQKLRFISRG